jgi:hypothetical protein
MFLEKTHHFSLTQALPFTANNSQQKYDLKSDRSSLTVGVKYHILNR